MVERGSLPPTVAVAALFVLTALAGCASELEGAEGSDGTIKTEIVDDDASEAVDTTNGRVSGVVLHASGFPLPGARITVMSVETSAVSNASGMFSFPSVPAGKQMMRVEKETYQTLQQPFDVVAGKLTRLEVTLVPGKGAEGGFSEHFHDHWRGADTYTLFDGTLKFSDDITKVPPGICTPGLVYINGITTYDPACYYLHIHPEEGQIVPPGTAKVTVELAFEPGALFSQEAMYFYMYPPTDSEGKYYYMGAQVASGSQQYEYELPTPEITDHGHARWTDWRFMIYWGAASSYVWGDWYNAMFRSPVDVTITAHKGELVLDPPHARFWAASDTRAMEFSEPAYVSCSAVQVYYCGARSPNPTVYTFSDTTYCFSSCLVPAAGHVIPPGTTRLDFTIERQQTDATAAPAGALFDETDWVIGYKTAAAAHNRATWDDYTWLEPLETYAIDRGEGAKYSVQVTDEQADSFYAKTSSWVILPAVRGHEQAATFEDVECPHEACGSTVFRLVDLTAVNENRDEMMEEGLA